ncbi:hypothetical protein EVAR_80138_1 [Eumeta japonica]|uniref:Uncharacterized protein n=1 Tax=Eumeta variegata TaxID=151549 RepID=A0A4C1YHB7_EUMVA|nr:hypothetical protein EVAR_80138_1 [Eumeta japonica]
MTVLTTDRVLVDIKTLLQFWFLRTVELFDEERTDLRLGVRALLIIARLTANEKTAALVSAHVELFDEERHRLETWRTGAANHRSTDRERENGAAALVSAHVELFDEERHRLETWRTGAANHRSTDRERETVQRRWSPRMWNSSTKNGTDLRLGVRALLIIARLTVNEKRCSGAGLRACGTLRRRTAQT